MVKPDGAPPLAARTGVPPGGSALLKLLTFLSPAFPVGAFAYSHGLEWLVDRGTIRTADDLKGWLSDLLELGSGWNDAVLLAAAHRASRAKEAEELRAVAELAEALSPSRERHIETVAQGRAFLAAVSAAWPSAALAQLEAEGGAAYPVAVGAAAGIHDIPRETAVAAYLNAFVSNLVSVAVRLIPIGQTAGLQTLAALHPLIAETADRAARSGLDDLGSATVLSDIASMHHETQYTRVFRT